MRRYSTLLEDKEVELKQDALPCLLERNCKLKQDAFKREETYVYLWLIHIDIWQKLLQYLKQLSLN